MKRFIDSNIFIYFMANVPKKSDKSKQILDEILSGKVTGVTSTYVLGQVCAFLSKQRAFEPMRKFLELISTLNIDVLSTDWNDFVELRKRISNKREAKRFDDWLIKIQMDKANIQEIYSADTDFDSLGVKRIF